jgi:hypothetical protein
MKIAVVWDVTPRDSCKNLRFGGTYRLLHHGEKNLRDRNNFSSNYQLKYVTKYLFPAR